MSGSDQAPVLTLEIDDQISPGAAAAAASLDKLATSATVTETKVAALGVTASSLVNKLDPVTRAQSALATQGDVLARGLAAGTITADQYSSAMSTLTARVTTAGNAHLKAEDTIAGVGNQTRSTTMLIRDATAAFAELNAGLSPLEIAALHMGNLEHATEAFGAVVKQAFAFITSGPGIALAAGAAFLAIGTAAEQAASRVAMLQTNLQAVNGSAAPVVTQIANTAAHATANTGASSLADTTAAAVAFLNQPSVIQTPANIERLITDSADLAAIWGVTMPDAAKKLADGLSAPGALAKQLANDNFAGMNDTLARSIQLMADSGDKAGAFATLLGVVEQTAHNAANTSRTELQQALTNLSAAFNKTGADGKSLSDVLGVAFDQLAGKAVNAFASIVTAIQNARQSWSGIASLANVVAAIQSGNPVGAAISAYQGVSAAPSGPSAASPILQWLTSGQYGNGSSTYTPAQIQAALINQGVPANDAAKLTAISGAESSYGANPVGPVNTNGTTDYGLFQINSGAWPQLNPSSLPSAGLDTQAAAAATVYRQQGLTAWSTYNLGKYQQFMSPVGTANNPLQIPDVSVTPGAASTNNPAQTIQTALTAATAGSSFQTADAATASIKQYTSALSALAAQGVTSGHDVDVLTEALTKAQLAQFDAVGPAAKLIQTLQEQTAQQNQLSTAWGNGYAAEGLAVAQVKAEQQARTVAQPGTDAYTDAVTRLTAAQVALATAQQSVQAGAALADQQQQLQYLQAETQTLGESADIRTRDLAVLQEQQTIAKTLPDISQQQKDALLAGAAAIANQNTNLQQTQAALTEVSNLASSAFDQLGSAIANSFESGTGSAVNWGNTVKTILATILEDVAKLAILNPILNSVTGSSLTTLTGVVGALSGSGGVTSTASTAASALSGGSSFSSLSSLFQLGSGANTLLGSPLSISGLANSLGLSGLSGGVSGILNTALIGPSLTGAGAVYGPVTSGLAASGAGLGTTTIGGALGIAGGIGAGYGLGSVAGGYLQSALNKTGPAPQIGAGIGALSGAAIGSIVPGIGTLIGGALGGLLGGAGGGLIGPHPATPYTNIPISIGADGTLQLGQLLSQGEDATPDVQDAQAQQAALNALLTQSGISLVSTGGINRVGNPVQAAAPGKATDIESAFGGFGFNVADTSTDEGKALASQVNGQSFGSVADLQSVFTEVDTFVNQTLPSLTTQQTNIGSLATTLNNLSASFTPAIAEGTKLGVGVDALTAAYNKQIDAANSAVTAQAESDQAGFQASYLSAAAQVSGSPQDAQTAALYAFDNVTAPQDRQQLITEYQGIFGDAYATTEQYVDSSAALEKSLGEQRLAIQSQYNDSITSSAAQAAGASLTSLQAYVQKLEGSSDSPLSATDQYNLAKSQFNAVSGAAQAGDANSIGNLPTYADSLLAASRAVNGSGIGYATDYNSVLSSVSNVASLGADTLTQSFFAVQVQSQTAALLSSQAQIVAAIAGLQSALSTASMQPARIAA